MTVICQGVCKRACLETFRRNSRTDLTASSDQNAHRTTATNLRTAVVYIGLMHTAMNEIHRSKDWPCYTTSRGCHHSASKQTSRSCKEHVPHELDLIRLLSDALLSNPSDLLKKAQQTTVLVPGLQVPLAIFHRHSHLLLFRGASLT